MLGAQRAVDGVGFRRHAVPACEAERGLLHQHAQAVDHVVAAVGACPGQERDGAFAVAQVDRGGAPPDQRGRQARQFARAAGGGGVDDQVELAQRGQVVHVARMHAPGLAEQVHQGIGARRRAVDHEQVADAGVEQRRRHAARGAAGADQQRAARAQVQRMAAGEVAHQAGAVGVVAVPGVAVAHQGVGGAGATRVLGGVRAQGEGGFLQRRGDVGAGAATGGEFGQRLLETGRLRVDRAVVDGDPGLPAERGVDARRERMRDGMSEHRVMPAHRAPPRAG